MKLNKTQLRMLRVGYVIGLNQPRLLKHAQQLVDLGLGTIINKGYCYSFRFKVRMDYGENVDLYIKKVKAA